MESTVRRLDLGRPSLGKHVGDIERFVGLRARAEKVTSGLAANALGDDVADVRRTFGRGSDPERHGFGIETERTSDGSVDGRAEIEDRSTPSGGIGQDGGQDGAPHRLQAV